MPILDAHSFEFISRSTEQTRRLGMRLGALLKCGDVVCLAGAVYGLAYVGEDFDPTAGSHAAAGSLADLGAILASYQILPSGGFAWNSAWVIPDDGDESIQETAYAILALDKLDRAQYLDRSSWRPTTCRASSSAQAAVWSGVALTSL